MEDAEARVRRREREAERRAGLDQEYFVRFAGRVRELFPHSPAGREQVIAEHACQKYSGWIGRSAGAKNLDTDAILPEVTANIRHNETRYDELPTQGLDCWLARNQIKDDVDRILNCWKTGK